MIGELEALAEPKYRDRMTSFGIDAGAALGVPVPALRALARRIGRDHGLAQALWSSGVHEARILATMVADPPRTTSRLLEDWVKALNSWDLCDHFCGNLVALTPFAWQKAEAWSGRRAEFVKRAGFAVMATLAVHDAHAPDNQFIALLAIIERRADEDRNFAKKAINWALRQIGKRNPALHGRAVATADRLAARTAKPARWIGSDALRELRDAEVLARIHKRAGTRHAD